MFVLTSWNIYALVVSCWLLVWGVAITGKIPTGSLQISFTCGDGCHRMSTIHMTVTAFLRTWIACQLSVAREISFESSRHRLEITIDKCGWPLVRGKRVKLWIPGDCTCLLLGGICPKWEIQKCWNGSKDIRHMFSRQRCVYDNVDATGLWIVLTP